jgi:hypothetical protein
MKDPNLNPDHILTEAIQRFDLTNKGMSPEDTNSNIKWCVKELRRKGVEGELFIRHGRRGRAYEVEVYGMRLETDMERSERLSYHRERRNDRYINYLDLKSEFAELTPEEAEYMKQFEYNG